MRCEYQESWTLLCSACFIHIKVRGRSCAETFEVQDMDKHKAIAVADLNKKTDTFLLMKREDNKHTIPKKLYGVCVFFK